MSQIIGLPLTRLPGGKVEFGPIYAPTYWIEGTKDKVMIDDKAFISTEHENEAAKIAVMRRVDTTLAGLIWTRKVGVVTDRGILSRKGTVGPFEVLFVAGPTFDQGRRSDDQVIAARIERGLPTGEPGARKITVASKADLHGVADETWRR